MAGRQAVDHVQVLAVLHVVVGDHPLVGAHVDPADRRLRPDDPQAGLLAAREIEAEDLDDAALPIAPVEEETGPVASPADHPGADVGVDAAWRRAGDGRQVDGRVRDVPGGIYRDENQCFEEGDAGLLGDELDCILETPCGAVTRVCFGGPGEDPR